MITFTLKVSCDTEQPSAFVESAAAAAVKGILGGWTDNAQVQLVREGDARDN